jgi:hypothetical protein
MTPGRLARCVCSAGWARQWAGQWAGRGAAGTMPSGSTQQTGPGSEMSEVIRQRRQAGSYHAQRLEALDAASWAMAAPLRIWRQSYGQRAGGDGAGPCGGARINDYIMSAALCTRRCTPLQHLQGGACCSLAAGLCRQGYEPLCPDVANSLCSGVCARARRARMRCAPALPPNQGSDHRLGSESGEAAQRVGDHWALRIAGHWPMVAPDGVVIARRQWVAAGKTFRKACSDLAPHRCQI